MCRLRRMRKPPTLLTDYCKMSFLSMFVTDCINGATFLIQLMFAFSTSITDFTFGLEFSISIQFAV